VPNLARSDPIAVPTLSDPISVPTSNDPTSLRASKATKHVHQQSIHNNPIPVIMEEKLTESAATLVSTNPFPKRQVSGNLIDSKRNHALNASCKRKRNHARNASCKRTHKLIDTEIAKDNLVSLINGIHSMIYKGEANNDNNSPQLAEISLITFDHVLSHASTNGACGDNRSRRSGKLGCPPCHKVNDHKRSPITRSWWMIPFCVTCGK